MKHFVSIVFLLFSAFLLLFLPDIARQGIISGISVCTNTILPILFPFLVVSNLWLSLGYGLKLGKWLAPMVEKVFHLPGTVSSALVIGAIGGYPTGAQAALQLYNGQQISKTNTERLLFFCNNAGPAFLIGIVGSQLFEKQRIGVFLWSIHVLSAFLLGVLFRPEKSETWINEEGTEHPLPFLNALTEAIRKAGQTTIHICMFILFFSVCITYVLRMLPNNLIGAIVAGSIELTTGCKYLGMLELSQDVVFVTISALAGWGGLCVHMQTVSMIYEEGLSCKHYLTGKLLQTILSVALSCLFAPFLSLDLPCVTAERSVPTGAICVLISLLLLFILKSSSGKVAKVRI